MINNLSQKRLAHNTAIFAIFAFISQMGLDMFQGKSNPNVYVWLILAIGALAAKQFLKD